MSTGCVLFQTNLNAIILNLTKVDFSEVTVTSSLVEQIGVSSLRLRSSQYPLGLPDIVKEHGKARSAVMVANQIVDNTVDVMRQLMTAGVAVSIENPKSSLLLVSTLGQCVSEGIVQLIFSSK